eukprot:Gb_25516 [translate_table: standard]
MGKCYLRRVDYRKWTAWATEPDELVYDHASASYPNEGFQITTRGETTSVNVLSVGGGAPNLHALLGKLSIAAPNPYLLPLGPLRSWLSPLISVHNHALLVVVPLSLHVIDESSPMSPSLMQPSVEFLEPLVLLFVARIVAKPVVKNLGLNSVAVEALKDEVEPIV